MFKCPYCEKELTFLNCVDTYIIESSLYLYEEDFLHKPSMPVHRIMTKTFSCPNCGEQVSPRDFRGGMMGIFSNTITQKTKED